MTVFGKIFKWFFIAVFSLFGLTVAASVIVAAFDLTLNLDTFRPAVEAAVSSALDRKVRITGPVRLTPTLRPTLEIQGLEIDNPAGWTDEVFASMDLARLQVGIPALLKKRIDIGEMSCAKVNLHLETNKDGVSNWQFDTGGTIPPEPETTVAAQPGGIGLQALDVLSMQDIRVTYRENSLDQMLTFSLDELTGTAGQGEPLRLKGRGMVQEKAYNFTIEGGALEDFHPRLRMYPLVLSGTLANSPFTAKGALGRDNSEPKLDLDLTLTDVDIGGLLSSLRVAEGVEAETDELALKLNLRGDSLRKLVTESNMRFSLKGGSYILHGAGNGDGVPIAIDRGEVSALSGKPVALKLAVSIATTPVTIAIEGMELVNYVGEPRSLPVAVKVEAAGTRLELKGKLVLPVRNKDLTLGMTIRGKSLDDLNQLFGVDLPPFGPYSLKARFTMQESGYDLSRLKIQVGTSDLSGSLHLDMAGDKPVAEMKLVSSLLQMNDFDIGDWSPEGNSPPEKREEKRSDSKTTGKEKGQSREKVASLLSQETLSRTDAHLQIRLDKVMSGNDFLGSGRLEVGLKDGRFSVDPLDLTLADGTIHTEFSYLPTANHARIHLLSKIKNLDLGILGRRIKPESRMGGQLYLDLQLDAAAPSLDQLMANGRGHLDFAFIPENFDAGLVDMWAVNLLSSLARETDGRPNSVINCMVAGFVMKDGVMRERSIFLDTTNMSIEGEATINFKNRTLAVKAAPKAKKPEFFSLATPVMVNGSFDDLGVKINMIRMAGTVTSFITSPVHVPLRRIFSRAIPADGKEACREAWDRRNLWQ